MYFSDAIKIQAITTEHNQAGIYENEQISLHVVQ